MEEKVLIVGAGPTGLVLALWLTKFGIPIRLIDKDSGPGQTSRAVILHARTLESYQQLGFAEEVVAKGIIIERVNIQKNGEVVAAIDLGSFGREASPFPFILSFPQDDHEKLLLEQLERAGVFVERNTEFLSYKKEGLRISAQIKKDNQIENVQTPYLLGCDGASSTVRNAANINFSGGTYSELFYVADVLASGDIVNGYLQLCLTENAFTLAFPVRSGNSIRLIGIVPRGKQDKERIEFADVADAVIRDTKLKVSKVNWFSTYHSHHRVADRFQEENVFLLGDAAHIHSPVGAQGMNTGIGDAVNLAWKIAERIQKRVAASILETYELERIGFARKLLSTTDKMFQAVTNPGLLGNFFRNIFFPYLAPRLLNFEKLRYFLFKTVSQIQINYRQSPLSEGRAGKIRGGDRLPWVKYETTDNFQSLQEINWQIHIYGEALASFKEAIADLGLKLSEFLWNENASLAGLHKNAVYLIRPDGYVAYANLEQEVQPLREYWARLTKESDVSKDTSEME